MTALGKTDVKWLIERFGEPAEHQSLAEPYSKVVRKAVARYCWSELANQNSLRKSLGMPELTLPEWLREQAKMYLGYAKERQARIVEVREQQKAFEANFKALVEALHADFAIVDIETTGWGAGSDEIIEIGALLVGPGFVATGEFSTLVKATRPVPKNITQLTGIEQPLLNREGASLRDAMERFQAFVGSRPVFAHNAPFDQKFLAFAATRCGTSFSNIMHATLSLSRLAFPGLDSYKLINLVKHVGAQALPNHRAIGDAKATLAILRAASKELEV
jgi:DNA polymerase-3 subunit epsilon